MAALHLPGVAFRLDAALPRYLDNQLALRLNVRCQTSPEAAADIQAGAVPESTQGASPGGFISAGALPAAHNLWIVGLATGSSGTPNAETQGLVHGVTGRQRSGEVMSVLATSRDASRPVDGAGAVQKQRRVKRHGRRCSCKSNGMCDRRHAVSARARTAPEARGRLSRRDGASTNGGGCGCMALAAGCLLGFSARRAASSAGRRAGPGLACGSHA